MIVVYMNFIIEKSIKDMLITPKAWSNSRVEGKTSEIEVSAILRLQQNDTYITLFVLRET